MKTIYLLIITISLFSFSPASSQVVLKENQAMSELKQFDKALTLRERKILKECSLDQRKNLSRDLQKKFDERQALKSEVQFWNDTKKLKNALLELPSPPKVDLLSREKEAEIIAQTAIQGFRDLKEKYHMIRPAYLQNTLINIGIKNQGFCWHWTRDLMHRMEKLPLHYFDFQWATAYRGKLREHNTLVMVNRGDSLENGLLLDGWRHSGKPFWILVKKDKKYPWKPGEFLGVENENIENK